MVDRVSDGRGDSDVRDLRASFGAERMRRLAELNNYRLDIRCIQDRGSVYIEKPLIERGAGPRIKIESFAQCISQCLGRAAQDLSLDDQRIDVSAPLLRRDISQESN